MIILADNKIPYKAYEKLHTFGEVCLLETSGIVYDAISGHPDIFFTVIDDQLIVAPNLPDDFFKILDDHKIEYTLGEESVGEKYPKSSKYNTVADDDFLIHNFRNTDSAILKAGEDFDLIHVDQGYTRCNLLSLGNKHYITSDKGIARTLNRFNLEVLYVEPHDILLPGFKHGFIGGCAGIWNGNVFFIGSLNHYKDGEQIKRFIQKQNLKIIELYNGHLFDGGSLIFI